MNVIKRWIKTYWKDFASNPETVEKTKEFLEIVSQANSFYTNTALTILAQIQRNEADPALKKLAVPIQPLISPSKNLRSDLTSIFDLFRVEDIAKQISQIEWNLFKQLRSEEFHDTAWMKPNKHKTSPNSTSPLHSLYLIPVKETIFT